MGKKSLFETTSQPEPQPDPQPEQASEQATQSTSEPEPAIVTPAATDPAPKETNHPTPPRPAASHHHPSPTIPANRPQDIPGGSVFKNPLTIMAVCLGFLLLMITIASHINSNRYFIKEKNGAVEIWQGDFTPTGQNRLMILHGEEWPGAIKDFYTQQEALGFARNVYLEKAQTLLNDPGPLDHNRISAYLKQTLALLPEKLAKKNKDQLAQIEQYLTEAAVLNNSEEKVAVDLAQKKLEAVQHAIAALLITTEPSPQGDQAEAHAD